METDPTTGFAAVTLAWVFAAAVGAVPMLAAGTFSSLIDAYFEAMSGFTTTGSTLLAEIEPEPEGVLMWRQLMQWLGGVGIVVLVVAIAPVSMPGMQRAFFAEASGITAERLTPRIVDTAKILAGIYAALTAACGVAYTIAGMNAFDSVAHAMSTVATAGFSTKTASIGHFDSVAIETVAIVFMIAGGVNFALYWRAIRRRPLMPPLAEVLAYLAIIAVSVAALTVSLMLADDVGNVAESLRASAFSVVTVATTTGYVTADFDLFNHFARLILLGLMIIGACAGSTAGGLKVSRAILLAKSGGEEVRRQVHPRTVQVLRLGGRTFSEETRRAVFSFFLVYVLIFAAGVLALGASGLDPVTAFSGTAATLNLIGPGLGEVGAYESFEAFSPFARVVGSILMLIGRLEIFTVVALLAAIFAFRARR
ncbi:MAG TPA: TrkH family potassium uptake protein [Solirubrobacterales bacterium]|nr:TrkH family potassium uptake protein [Solirubrobacterales bacterium]